MLTEEQIYAGFVLLGLEIEAERQRLSKLAELALPLSAPVAPQRYRYQHIITPHTTVEEPDHHGELAQHPERIEQRR